jgi:hypothetical protein
MARIKRGSEIERAATNTPVYPPSPSARPETMRIRNLLARATAAAVGSSGWIDAQNNWAIDAGDSEGYASTFRHDGMFNATGDVTAR